MIEGTGLAVSHEVAEALESRQPVVALESSVIAQGLPRPLNLEAAKRIETTIREAGAVPATLAILEGVPTVGVDPAALERLAFEDGIEKAGARDLGRAIATRSTMATTVGSSLVIANAAGIKVFATGGIGGVHRGAEETGDISNDLHILSTTPLVTVSAGFKSILDLPRTLEYLETLGVPVVGFKTTALPDFYGVDSGFSVPNVSDAAGVVRMLDTSRSFGLPAGLVVVNPPPATYALNREELRIMVNNALVAAKDAGVTGKNVTPFLLSQMANESDGRTVTLNIELLVSNARVAAEIAAAFSSL